jgi:hypothetical protein
MDAIQFLREIKRKKKRVEQPIINSMLNGKRYYIYCYAASTSIDTKDGIVFTEESFRQCCEKRQHFSYKVLYNFDKEIILGSGKLSGVEYSNGVYKLVANLVIVCEHAFSLKLNDLFCSLGVKPLSSYKKNGKRYVEKFKVEYLSLIDKKLTVDKYTKIFNILKDEDIDKRLEE